MANQKRRDQIANAALILFDARGYHATSMEDIAKAVGMRASSLYNHFRSKQELLAEVAINAMEELLRFNATAIAGIDNPVDKLAAAMRSHVIFHTTHARAARVINTEIGSLEEPHHSVVIELRRDYVSRWMKIVHDGMATGVFQANDVKISCWALIDMGIGVSKWYAEDGQYSPEELGTMYAGFALQQLLADARAEAR
ncbi:TetR/AcrR family transcriptional regulator [Corynebacterium lizhenjunii]|uniref:TetR/AcrR family transcriptional regulator n=1 Tax=Corynebacterium lizhenjunii TaxID=2709394 RepID=UPI0013EBAC4D|nr:TetR/AcrR family transcriptional regulator [Corynebacterium lizhenjunii]